MINDVYNRILQSLSYKPSDIHMSLWIKRFMWFVCFSAFFYAYYLRSYDGMAMMMAMSGIWILNSTLTKRKIIFYLDVACITFSLCIVDTLFISGELGLLGPFICLMLALITIFMLGLLWGNILGVCNCIFVSVVLRIEAFDWIRSIYTSAFCQHFPYIMVAFLVSAVFLQYSMSRQDLSRKGYRQQLEAMIEKGKKDRSDISLNMLLAMFKALSSKSPEISGHCESTAEWSKMISTAMGYSAKEIRRMYYAGLLHDIGKIGSVSDFYWARPDMSKEDRAEYIKHIDIGYQLVVKLGLQQITDATLYHHEDVLGNGHKGLKGDEIPEAARIVAISNYLAHIENDVDSYEEMIELIKEAAGKKFDTVVAEAAIAAINTLIKKKEEESIFGKVE